MVNVTVSTNTNRSSVAVDIDATINEVIDASGIAISNVALYLNGSVISRDEWEDTLEDFGVEDFSNATLVAVVKADSAR